MLKAIIIDDEKNGRNTLNYLINAYCEEKVRIVAMAENVNEGIEAIKLYSPDIVFLDVQMKKETGFDLLEKIGKIEFSIIFTTAYDQYALNAIKYSAVDYLLKPIDVNELNEAIDKVINLTKDDNLTENQKKVSSDNLKIAISSSNELSFIPISSILYCCAEKSYTYFYLNDGKKIVSTKNLKFYEDLLSSHNFMRIHNSNLINLKHVEKYNKGEGGSVIMSNGYELDVSKRKKTEFLNKILED